MTHAADIEEDLTFHPASAYGSITWTALTLGMTDDRFYRKRGTLEKHGFPKPDTLNKRRYIKADVLAWVERRRTIPNPENIYATVGAEPNSQEVNTNEL
jgi:predicted DNA-binding transcriptional regulator AlpA